MALFLTSKTSQLFAHNHGQEEGKGDIDNHHSRFQL